MIISRVLILLGVLATVPFHDASAESRGNLAQYPPNEVNLRITTQPDGSPKLEPMETVLLSGNYYRLNIACPDVRDDLTGWRIEFSEFLRNAHLRLVTVGDVEVHLQGLTFHAIECDEIGSAKVSLVPIKPGSFPIYVGNVPLAVGRPMGEAGVQAKGKFTIGSLIVE